MLSNYTAKYTKISSGYMGQLIEWPEVITEIVFSCWGKTLSYVPYLLLTPVSHILRFLFYFHLEHLPDITIEW